ncbi:hypothetical protein BDV96DRAFT_507959 [Lophiotrema nucula]|uniref:Caspase domain-containing protein n=1 Tax=Lophiotrema nucula TaxID=690887 RepID=A0A6A5YJN9_9PLEO|nr:hypothetical protein BDV96DRAFT_507959 [Lophiotrema nucula]
MALAWPSQSSGAIDTMETDISPKTSHSLKDKIFHADIRIESIEDVTKDESASPPKPIVQEKPSDEDVAAQERSAEMQMWFDEAIARNMNLPDGYLKVSVLIIKWADELDELKTRAEVEELEAVFSSQFHYYVRTVELDVSHKPQLRINTFLSEFIEENDGPNNLMIVYYTGHGVYMEHDQYLQLMGSTNLLSKRGFSPDAKLNWNEAEKALSADYIEGDVLTIMDTCYSSNLAKSGKEDTRTFELLSACAFDTTTAAPGPYSFTRALIDAMKELLVDSPSKSFSTFHLNQRILLDPRRRDTPSQLWFRKKHHERHIRLAVMEPERRRERTPSLLFNPPKGYLTLRFALRDDTLNREQVEYLTKNLSKAFHNKALVGLKRIDWLGLKPARATHFGRAALAIFAIAQWKKFLRKKKETRQSQRPVDDVHFPRVSLERSQTTSSTQSSPTRKRTRDNLDDYLPDAKRGSLVVPQPPSPPVSDQADDSGLTDEAEVS